MKNDKLYDLEIDANRGLGTGKSQIRIALQWIYSKVKLLEDILAQLRTQLDADMISKQEAEDELAAMEQPFGNFLFRQAERAESTIGDVNLARKFVEYQEVTSEEE